jgi:glutamate-ammonia-ligase adenylyltransferase
LALGKWGGRELGFKSDLDFVFVSPTPPSEKHHRLVRRFISRLRDPSAGGSIYNLDTRLRPEGKGGALIIEESALYEFLEHKALAWERQAYLKGRWVNRDLRFQHSMIKGLSSTELEELKTIRSKLLRPPHNEEISLKLDEGGLVDIELSLQTMVLAGQLDPLSGSTQHFFECLKKENSFLHQHYFEIRKLEQMASMLSMESDPKFSLKKAHVPLIAKILGREPEELFEGLKRDMKSARQELIQIDPIFKAVSPRKE